MTVPAEVREHWREARVSARADGLVPALTLLVRALSPGASPRGPRGHAVLPKELLEEFAAMEAEDARREQQAEQGTGAGDGATGDGHERRRLSEFSELKESRDDDGPVPGLAVLRPGEGDADAVAGSVSPSASRDWSTGLAWLRLGVSERLRDASIAYLALRQVEGTSLLMQQMVKGALADVLIEHLEIEGFLDDLADGIDRVAVPLGPRPPIDERELTRLQAQITRADRTLLRLLGAHGFTAEGPGMTAHASELLADVYCGGTTEADA
ncbi:hypothetical protein [Streptomyces sp. NPDC005485]|uniref:hypothetical protein n=1 Tax=Streptomyces sp. NPDC005485 TaxID=3155591 RepID=UPI0033A22E98